MEYPEDLKEQLALTNKWAREARVRPVDIGDLDPKAIATLLTNLATVHHLDGVASEGSPPILLFRLPDRFPHTKLSPANLTFFPLNWRGRFGASLALTVYCLGLGRVSRVCLHRHSPGFLNILGGRYYAGFIRDRRIISAFEVDFTQTLNAHNLLQDQWNKAQHHTPEFFHDEGAHYWEISEEGSDPLIY